MTRSPGDRTTPWWGLASSLTAPVLLVGGWTVAAALQPEAFDSTTDSISALAALDAEHRWVMSVALLGVGVCHVITAMALRPARGVGRVVLAVGGTATVVVALNPLSPGGRTDTGHTAAALIAFTALATWPAISSRGQASADQWGLRTGVSRTASSVLLTLLGWYVVELAIGGGRVGLAERWAAGAQAGWPLVVAATTIGARRYGDKNDGREWADGRARGT